MFGAVYLYLAYSRAVCACVQHLKGVQLGWELELGRDFGRILKKSKMSMAKAKIYHHYVLYKTSQKGIPICAFSFGSYLRSIMANLSFWYLV